MAEYNKVNVRLSDTELRNEKLLLKIKLWIWTTYSLTQRL